MPQRRQEPPRRHCLGEHHAAMLRRSALGRLQTKRPWPGDEPSRDRGVSGGQSGAHQPQYQSDWVVLRNMKFVKIRTEIPGPNSRKLMAERKRYVPQGPFHVTPIFVAT